MPDERNAQGPRPKVVIVGGGFGGVAAAQALRDVPVEVTVVDRTNHYLFQPLLYQVASGLLSPADIASPIRFLLRRQRNATVLMATVDRIDLQRRHVVAGRLLLDYDYLILAAGARHSYFGHPEWETLAPGLKTLEDARRIRHRFLTAFEAAESTDDPAERDALLTFVIVGGGPTGVELAGVLPTIARKGMRADFRRIDPARIKVILLEGGKRILPTFPDTLSQRACRDLEALGVVCRTGALVTRLTPDAVYVGDERIPTRTVFWAAGNAASPLAATMGVPLDRAGRVMVAADLSVPGWPEVFVVGDAAAAVMPPRGGEQPSSSPPAYVPGLAAAAQQMGAHAGAMIARTVAGRAHTPFRYRNRGALAVIGRGHAIADFDRIRLTGRIAWWTWLAVHLAFLAGFRNRVSVLLEWAYAYWTFRPGARLITDDSDLTRVAAAEDAQQRLRPPA